MQINCEDGSWSDLAQDRDQQRASVNSGVDPSGSAAKGL